MTGFNKKTFRTAAIWGGLFLFFYVLGHFIPEGYDWRVFFSKGSIPSIWTPWTGVVVRFLSFPLIVAVTLFSVVARAYRYNKSPIPMALAIVSLPTMWVLFLGNLDGLVLLGLLVLPWGVPFVLMKPQLASFALLAKKRSVIAGVIWVLISFLIWGFWPLDLVMMTLTPEWKVEWVQDITLFPWGILIAIPLMWFSRGDEDLLMAAGSFATPHLFPYHFVLLMPALARMKVFWMVLCWAISWTPLLANWFGPIAWHMGNVLAGCLWLGIYLNKKTEKKS